MKNMSKFLKYRVVLLSILVFGVLVSGCVQEQIDRGIFAIERGEKGAPSTPITISLSMQSNPKINEVIEITCTVSSILDAPNTTAEITLPEGVDLINGDLIWEGDLEANKPVSFSARIKITKAKNLAIEAVARHVIDEENSWGDIDVIYLNYSPTREVAAERID